MNEQTKPQTPAGGPLGDTGDGDTGVPEFEQGISNRPGDRGARTDEDEGQDVDADLDDPDGDAVADTEN